MTATTAPGLDQLHRREAHPTAFPHLTEEQMRRLEPLATCHTFEHGEKLFAAGDAEIGFFVIRQGNVRILQYEDGRATLIHVHGPGDFTGELQMVSGQPAFVDAVADGRVRAMRLEAESLRKVLAEESEVGEVILRALLERRSLLEKNNVATVRLIGSRWSPQTFALRDFLSRHRVLHRWIDVESDPAVEGLLRALDVKPDETPVLVCDAGEVMRNPTIEAVASCLGLRKSVDQELYDLAIIGAGPGGLAAAVYGASEGLRTLVVDSVAPGGQAGTSSKIENYLGFPTGISGADLANAAATQARKFRATITSPARAEGIDCDGPTRRLKLDGGEAVFAKAIILATGAQYRKINADGFERFEQTGIYYGCTHTEAVTCRNEDVVVVGGGNSAGQAAVFLAGFARRVQLLIRGENLVSSMSRYLIARIEGAANIALRPYCQIAAFHGEQHLESVTVRCNDGREDALPTKAVFVMIGADPNTRWLNGCVGLDPRGFIVTGEDARRHAAFGAHWNAGRQPFLLETTQPGIFAVGDVRSGSVKRVASAVGEGAMAVKFVHEALAT